MKKAIIVLLVLAIVGVMAFVASRRIGAKSTVTQIDPKKLFRPQTGVPIPSELTFRDETGARVTMGQYGKDRPYIIVPVWYRCPSLCDIRMQELVKGLVGVAAYSVGKDYDVVVVSFDPDEGPELAAAKKASTLEAYGQPESEGGWHFLTGEQDQITGLLDAIGYGVQWDDEKKEYLHASGIVICSPEGVIRRYFTGLDYRPLYMRLALAEASEGTVRMGVIDQVLLPCFRFDEKKGKYSAGVLTLVKGAGVLTMALLGLVCLRAWLFPRRADLQSASPAAADSQLAPHETTLARGD